MIKLNPLTVQAISISTEQHSTLQWSDKALFEYVYADYKAVAKGSRGKVTELLMKLVATQTESTNVQKSMRGVFKVAQDYCDMKVIANFSNLEYSNVSNLVKLFKYVDKHLKDKSNELREGVKALYEDGMSPHRYNNVVALHITKLKEEYKLKEQEGAFVFQDVFNMVQASVTKMTNEQLRSLIALAERNIVEEEVA